MRIPAALQRWAAEHNHSLSASTRAEVDVIASIIDASSLRDHEVEVIDEQVATSLEQLFPPDRAERAGKLIEIVSAWAVALPPDTQRTTIAEVRPRPATQPSNAAQPPAAIGSPAFLRSDKVDEDDSALLFGSAGAYLRVVFAVLSLLAVAAAGVVAWLWISSRGTDVAVETDATAIDEPAAVGTPSDEPEPAPTSADESAPTAEPSTAPTATTEPIESDTADPAWADTTTILNPGVSEILASTYPVSAANRAVLTGHTAAITGLVVSDDGRVLTSGADMRLVDWGSDVTIGSPDPLNVSAPLTVLARTVDQRLIAGDSNGNLTVIDLVNTVEPIVVNVHPAAISAVTELIDGRLAVASVDGDVKILAIDTPGDAVSLPHSLEVTAVVGLADGRIATAAVDGIVRLWLPEGGAPIGTIETSATPITTMTALRDGRLATGSIDGNIQIVLAEADSDLVLDFSAHVGPIRVIFEFDDPTNGASIATGGDDSTIRVFALADGTPWQQLEGHGDLVSAISQLPDGRLVSASADGTGRVWDLSLVTPTLTDPPHDANLSDMVPWRDDQFVTGGVDGLVVRASTNETFSPTELTRFDSPVVGLAANPGGQILAVDAASTLRLLQVDGTPSVVAELSVSPGATSLDARGELGIVTGHADGTVRFHDLVEEFAVADVHGSGVNDVLALGSGQVASAGADMTVRIISLDTPDIVPVFDLHTAPVDVLAELPDGRIASAGTDGIYVWSAEDMGAEHIRLNGHRSRTLSLIGLPDGRLVSSAADGRVRVWDLNAPDAEPATLIDVPGIVNPALARTDNGLLVAGAGRGYVVFAAN